MELDFFIIIILFKISLYRMNMSARMYQYVSCGIKMLDYLQWDYNKKYRKKIEKIPLHWIWLR